MAVIGIDLGTTYSAASRFVNGTPEIINLEGRPTLPSVVGVQKSGKIAIGWTAKRNQVKYPTNTVVEVKRLMGDNKKVRLGEKEYTPQEISAFILTRIKELAEAELGEPVTGAVISCPAYFMDPARAATKEAGELAGLNVLRIVNEPTAAAYAYGVREGDATPGEKLYVVYDLGGGTFDVTVIKTAGGMLDVIGTGGDPQLGGANFDDRIVDWMVEHIRNDYPDYWRTLNDDQRKALRMRLKIHAEEAKIGLCTMPGDDAAYQFNVAAVDMFQAKPITFNKKLTRSDFEGLIATLLQDSLHWIDEALKAPKETLKYTEENLTAILLVGGSTRVPLVRKVLEKRFPSTPIWGQERGINPDEIVAMGASLVAADADITAEEAGPGAKLVDVTGHTLSVEVHDDRRGDILVPLIPKETQIPWEAKHRFQSEGRGQTHCRVRVYQGEGTDPRAPSVTMIAEFIIEIAPIEKPTPIMIGFDLDKNGILIAHATNELNGQKVLCRIDYTDSLKMTPDELARRKAALQEQLSAGVQQAPNPLTDDGAPQAQQGAAVPSGAAMVPPSADPTAAMNGIMRMMYGKAVNNFLRVPEERQGALIQLVGDIESAARAGDREKLDAYLPQLTKLLEGVT